MFYDNGKGWELAVVNGWELPKYVEWHVFFHIYKPDSVTEGIWHDGSNSDGTRAFMGVSGNHIHHEIFNSGDDWYRPPYAHEELADLSSWKDPCG